MSSLAELSELVGFFSYSRDDDDAFRGALSALRDGIHRELSAQLGRSKSTFRLWQDQEAIAPGKLWESEIKKAIDESFFFIPIVTPRSVGSKYCKFEFESFLAREKEIGRSDLVFPILYISVPALESEAKWRDDPVLSTIGRRQYVDWRPLRYLDVQTSTVREQIGHLCQRIVEALNQAWISPEERRRIEEAQARQQAEEEERRREIEAKRRAEEQARRLEFEVKRRAEEEARRLQAEAERKAKEEQHRKQLEAKAREAEAKRLADEEKRRRRAEGSDEAHERSRWRVQTAAVVGTVALLLLIGWGGYAFFGHILEKKVQQAALKWEEERTTLVAEANRKVEEAERDRQAKAAAEAEQKRKADEAEQQRLAAVKAEQDRQAEAKRKADEAERQRLEQDRQARVAAGAEAKRKVEEAERIANLDNRSICQGALNNQKSGWDQNPYYATHVTEASRRSLTVDSCRAILGIGTAEAEAKRKADEQQRQANISAERLFSITRGVRVVGTEYTSMKTNTIELCSIKCYGDLRCKMFSFWDSQQLCYLFDKRLDTFPNSAAQVGYRPSTADEAEQRRQAESRALPDRLLCENALNSQKTGWEPYEYYKVYVTETSRRGLTVDSCRAILGIGEEAERQRLFTIRRGVEAVGSAPGFSETFFSRSIEDCEQKCGQQPTCNVYTYKKSNFRCYLYSRFDLTPNADFDSGVRN
jgi:hypothetical protein